MFVPENQSAEFEQTLQKSVGALDPLIMLTHGVAAKYEEAVGQRLAQSHAQLIAGKAETSNTSYANVESLFLTRVSRA